MTIHYVKVRPIRTDKDYKDALKRVDEIFDSQPGTPEFDELDVLATLVEAYEDIHYPIGKPSDPIEVLKFWMDQKNLKQVDLVPYIGHKSQVSEILAGKRKLTLKMIRKLHQGLGITVESLIY